MTVPYLAQCGLIPGHLSEIVGRTFYLSCSMNKVVPATSLQMVGKEERKKMLLFLFAYFTLAASKKPCACQPHYHCKTFQLWDGKWAGGRGERNRTRKGKPSNSAAQINCTQRQHEMRNLNNHTFWTAVGTFPVTVISLLKDRISFLNLSTSA